MSTLNPAWARRPGLAALAAAAAAWLRALGRSLAGSWRHALAREQFARLDDFTVRDLGMSRSEFSSYFAESAGLVEPTRQRILRAIDRRLGL